MQSDETVSYRSNQPPTEGAEQLIGTKSFGKHFEMPMQVVYEAHMRVKANAGAAGVDDISIAEFEQKLEVNLYKIWNRMSSGTYFPPPVMAVEIPKTPGDVAEELGFTLPIP